MDQGLEQAQLAVLAVAVMRLLLPLVTLRLFLHHKETVVVEAIPTTLLGLQLVEAVVLQQLVQMVQQVAVQPLVVLVALGHHLQSLAAL
jgi:hypothetical protein